MCFERSYHQACSNSTTFWFFSNWPQLKDLFSSKIFRIGTVLGKTRISMLMQASLPIISIRCCQKLKSDQTRKAAVKSCDWSNCNLTDAAQQTYILYKYSTMKWPNYSVTSQFLNAVGPIRKCSRKVWGMMFEQGGIFHPRELVIHCNLMQLSICTSRCIKKRYKCKKANGMYNLKCHT